MPAHVSRWFGLAVVVRASRIAAGIVIVAASLNVGAQTAALTPRTDTQPRTSAAHAIPVPSARAVRRSGPIAIDGRLDEAAWKDATPVTDFTQIDPEMGKPASQRTEMRFLFDDDAIYIGAKMYDTEGSKGVRTSLVRRDQQFNSDYIEIVIDGFHDHLGRAFFDLNPSGSKADNLGVGASCCDSGWDPIWEAGTHIDADGWTAEIRIPLNQLRFSRDPVQTWGLQLRRFINRNNEQDQWSYWSKTESGGPSRFGHLEGIEIKPQAAARHVELLPYAVTSSRNVAFTPGDPFNNGSALKAKAGLDLKYLLSSNLTLDATFNPDFGQVEVDPAVINLSAFETSFSEKRPFFVANSGIFSFGGFNCFFCSNVASLSAFYSRRIGRAPTGADLAYQRGPYADVPDASTIAGAAKITGRTSNGYTVGVLEAVTTRENARVQLDNGGRVSQEVEPLTNYFVGRLKKDFMSGNLVIGGMATSVVRQMDSTFAARLSSHAELLGGDFLYTWNNRVYSLVGQYALSSISGDRRAILARQRSSARYFQRPDRGAGSGGFLSNRLDSSATSMNGAGAYMRLGKNAGDWLWEAALNVRTPGFENNDLGFLTRADYVWYNANVFRYWTRPTSWYRDFSLIVGGQQQRNFFGDLTDRQAQVFLASTMKNFWNWSAFYIRHPELADDRLLRGGPVVLKPGTNFTAVNLNSDSRHAVIWSINADYASNDKGGWGVDYGTSVQYRPVSSVNLSLGPQWSASRSLLQYVTAVKDPAALAFYGSRYVLSGLKQKQLSLETRANMTFTPTMTLELYVQPFIASGQYYDFKEFDAPRTGRFSVYGRDRGTITPTRNSAGRVTGYAVDPGGPGPARPFSFANPDFNLRSLRGNAVFRWEYRPGSTLYVAWTHSRSDSQPYGDFDLNRDREGLFATRPDNIFLVKASWWLAR
ncbi:MAG TPA: DUF5916 domain-containing protein [Gemmatimonadaceae bacterium]|nr:DUF5916 domain-containing protein [Gemmatimonadaceae bacterium]